MYNGALYWFVCEGHCLQVWVSVISFAELRLIDLIDQTDLIDLMYQTDLIDLMYQTDLIDLWFALSCQMLQEDIQDHQHVQQGLAGENQRHLFGDDPSVHSVLKQYQQTDRQWSQLVEGTHLLLEEMLPWQQLVNKAAELGEWCKGVQERVKKEMDELGRVEEEDDDPSDFKATFKVPVSSNKD